MEKKLTSQTGMASRRTQSIGQAQVYHPGYLRQKISRTQIPSVYELSNARTLAMPMPVPDSKPYLAFCLLVLTVRVESDRTQTIR